jgi:membrane protease YdiL (CAAX protease family)
MKSVINWRIFFILLTLCLLSVLAVFPYILTLQGDLLEMAGIPLPTLFLVQFFQSAILFSIAIFIGLKLAIKVNYHLPLLEALVSKGNYKKILKDILPISVTLGIVTAILIFTVDYLFTLQNVGITTHESLAPVWQKLLASFYGGITEEVIMRLFLMTLLTFIGMKLLKQKVPGKGVVITSIILAAVIFGLGHLPITAALTQITPLIITRAIILNGIGGVIFGYLYWKKGLESAMIAHFTTDIILLTVLPILFT